MAAFASRPAFGSFLGFTPGLRGNAGNLKPPAGLLAAGASGAALEELLFALKRLDDFCLANRVIVFNQEDLAQVRGRPPRARCLRPPRRGASLIRARCRRPRAATPC